MQTKLKSNSIITHTVDDEGSAITFHVRGAGDVTLRLDALHAAIMNRAAVHGLIQRISDAAALSRDSETGQPATPQDKLEAMARLVAHYMSGTDQWSRVAAGAPKGGLLFKALCRMYEGDKTPDEIREFIDGLSDKEQSGLRRDEEVSAMIRTIEAEQAKSAPSVDTKSILGKLRA